MAGSKQVPSASEPYRSLTVAARNASRKLCHFWQQFQLRLVEAQGVIALFDEAGAAKGAMFVRQSEPNGMLDDGEWRGGFGEGREQGIVRLTVVRRVGKNDIGGV